MDAEKKKKLMIQASEIREKNSRVDLSRWRWSYRRRFIRDRCDGSSF